MAAEIIDDGISEIDVDEPGSALIAQSTAKAFSIASAEINQQVSTAKQYPRSLARVMARIVQLATLDEQAASECMYLLPRGGKKIVGPSIRLAEIVASQWGNCRVAARMTDIDRDNKRVEATGMFWDLETNVGQVATVQRRIVDKNGRLYNDDMILVTGNAACSIGRRNAIFMGVPKSVWRKGYEAAEGVVKGDIKTLAERKARMYARFTPFGITAEQIWAVLGIAGDAEIVPDHLPVMTGILNAIKNGDRTIEDVFEKPAPAFTKVADPLADKPAGGGGGGAPSSNGTGTTTAPGKGEPAETINPETGEVVGAKHPDQQPTQQNAAAPASAAAAGPGGAAPAPGSPPAGNQQPQQQAKAQQQRPAAQATASAPAGEQSSGLFTGDE